MKIIECVVFISIEKKKYFNDEFNNYRFEHNIKRKSIVLKTLK